ncbi:MULTISPECIES: ATP synthase subunit B family protein [Ehrlichia]|uniref:Putative aTP synthase F0, B chain n=1 Tax=Ehrlichia cf. muris str. EmCRT TaxID=1359167 RepID=A0A0F3N6U3_9RICK|nr:MULTISPECIES: ATP synthase subunit B [Ehrlichia]KJV63451.1 putative aTP synthase F0, B chain [Ehrlichia cf. muris str. EmCRT]OUC04509.1 ATP synthase subunit B [Ehrlichia sp. Wisconsin_h]
MISTYFVTNLAFCIGALATFWPLYKKIRQSLSSMLNKLKQEVILPYDIQKQSQNLLNSAIAQSHETEKTITEILKKAQEEYNLIISSNKKDIENIIEKHLDIAVQKISDQVSSMVQSLKLDTVDIATSAIQELIKEYNNDHQKQDNSGVLSTLDRDLRKKLH